MDLLIQQLKSCCLFYDLSEDTIKEEILPKGKLQCIPKGQYIISYQAQVDSFGIIIEGKVNTIQIYGNGHYGITDVLEAGDFLGIDVMCTQNQIAPYYAETGDTTQILFFPGSMILNCGTLPEAIRTSIYKKLLTYIADVNIRKEYRLAVLFQKGVRDRIMTYLTMQANKRRTNSFTIPFSRSEMASYLCVNRTNLSHELSLLEQEGVISFKRNQFTLLKWENHTPPDPL